MVRKGADRTGEEMRGKGRKEGRFWGTTHESYVLVLLIEYR